jgi:hypothetical protein
MTTVPEPSDATRFATRPKQRKRELVNATDNTLAKLRKETIAKAMDALDRYDIFVDHYPVTVQILEEGMWRQWVADDRTLDPETVAEQFARAEREYSAAIHNRAVIREYGMPA